VKHLLYYAGGAQSQEGVAGLCGYRCYCAVVVASVVVAVFAGGVEVASSSPDVEAGASMITVLVEVAVRPVWSVTM
jgi:hypothetical protein